MRTATQRVDNVYRIMRREDLDALILTRRSDIQYMTGYRSPRSDLPCGCVIIENEDPQLIVSELQRIALGPESILAKVRSFANASSLDWHRAGNTTFWNSVSHIINESNVQSGMVGVQHDCLSMKDFEKLRAVLPDAGFKDSSELLWRLREVKDFDEINAIIDAIKIAEIGARTAFETVVPGTTEEEASIEIEAAMRGAGGQKRGIRAAVLSGENSSSPFAEPSARRIREDDLVTIDITVSHAGYFAEIARTLHTGSPNQQHRNLFTAVLEVSRTIEQIMKPGLEIAELYTKAMEKHIELGDSFQVKTFLGNSIGIDLREPPFLIADSQSYLRENMVLSVSPSSYVEGVGGAKIADIFLVTSDGSTNLSGLARETI